MLGPADLIALALLLGATGPAPGDRAQGLYPAEEASGGTASDLGWFAREAIENAPVQHQVSIEQHVVIRIVPRSTSDRQEMSAYAPVPQRTRLVERKAGKCLPIANIGAVQPADDSRLMLFMRDRRLFSAHLDRGCSAREFYAGAYIDRNDDGLLCIDRDRLQSRTGVKCEVDSFHQLVAQ